MTRLTQPIKYHCPDGSELSYQFDADTDEITKTFQLSHRQKITFTDVPVGTTYTLTENNGNTVTNYDTTISGKTDGAEFTEKAMTVSNMLVGEDSNYADVENSYDANPITGIVFQQPAVHCPDRSSYRRFCSISDH